MKFFKKFLLSVFSLLFILSPITYHFVEAKESSSYSYYNYVSDKELEQKLSKEFEILFTEVITIDENGKYNFNREIATKKLGFNDEINYNFSVVVAEKNGIYLKSFKDCMYNKVKSVFGLPPVATFYTAIEQGAFREAAKIFISVYGKQLVKASPWILAGTLAGLAAYCYGK